LTKARPLLFSLVSALLGMSLVGAAIVEMAGAQIFPMGQVLLGGNVPMAALVLGVGFLIAAAEPAIQTTFTRLAILYAIASIFFQLVGGSQLGNHTIGQGIIVPVIAAVLLVVFHPSPRLIVPTSPTTRPTTTLS
jgi:hypothetical protein